MGSDIKVEIDHDFTIVQQLLDAFRDINYRLADELRNAELEAAEAIGHEIIGSIDDFLPDNRVHVRRIADRLLGEASGPHG